jgi:tetratricopeptide (TPR) repeat protein
VILIALLLLAQDLSRQGAQAMREGRFAEAERIYRQLATEAPSEPQWRMNLGLALHSEDKYAEALREFGRYLKAVPQAGPIHLLVGIDHLKLAAPCRAISPLESARRWQASKQVLTELADAYSGCNRYSEAAKVLEAAKELRLAARAHWQAREYDAAKSLFDAVSAEYASDAMFHYEYGDTLYRVEGAESALPHLQLAMSILAARGSLGRALLDLGRAAEAIPHLEAAVQADPTLLLPLSRSYKATGRVEDAARAEAEYRKRLSAVKSNDVRQK